ncbi:hypothetical protein HYV80_02865 [Candidatus Woesearchaeota archaeon]|nr:hypothetical protein [Candidatus Woesearchaeota archaeon]
MIKSELKSGKFVSKPSKKNNFKRLALKPTNQERFKFRIVTLLSIVVFGLWYIIINEKFFTIENFFILGIIILAVLGSIHYYRRL